MAVLLLLSGGCGRCCVQISGPRVIVSGQLDLVYLKGGEWRECGEW